MTNDDISHIDFTEFGETAAAFAKYLIRARWKTEPGFLSADDLQRWRLTNIEADPYPAWRLAGMAADAQGRLHAAFIPRSSGGIPVVDTSTTHGRLFEAVAFLASGEGVGPWFNQELVSAAAALAVGRAVGWRSLVRWELLPEIRESLDLLHREASGRKEESALNRGAVGAGPNIFRFMKKFWNIRYDGGALFATTASPGLFYIRELLRRPGREVPSLKLAAGRNRTRADKRASRELTEADGLVGGEQGLGEPALDEQALRELYKRRAELEDEIERAGLQNDSASESRLSVEWQAVDDHIRNAFSVTGDVRRLGSQANKTANTVARAISRSVDVLRKLDDRLGRHLDAFLTTGVVCAYAPDRTVGWET